MTDKAYRAWIQTLPSCLTGRYSEYLESGEKRNPACHVRRAKDAGTAYKPLFSAIPLTHLEHDIQTRNGELACLKEFLPERTEKMMFSGLSDDEQVMLAKAWFDTAALTYYRRWMAETPEGRAWAEAPKTGVMA